jgi:hypothetical protein
LVFGKELADATEFLPGPTSAVTLLAQTGLKERKRISIPAAVNSCSAAWLTSLAVQSGVSPVSSPVQFAILRKLETGDETAWIAGWESMSGIAQNFSIPMLTLGNLFYRERLLARFCKE